MAISERPWSDFSDKDYTIQQLHRAALIHTHTGIGYRFSPDGA